MNKLLKKVLLYIPIIGKKYVELCNLRIENACLQKTNIYTNRTKLKKFIRITEGNEIQINAYNKTFRHVIADITNYCNAECIFCINPRDQKPTNVTPEQFSKNLSILPFVQDCGFLFSCAWEPTLNPKFIDLLEMIPDQYREKVYFTTNLSVYLSDDDFHRLAKVAVNYINISLETFDLDKCKILVGVKKNYIFDNLERMSKIFKRYHNAPDIRFITIILKDNYDEILSLAINAYEKYNPVVHEFRTPFIFLNYNYNDDMVKQLLPTKKINKIMQQLEAIGYKHIKCINEGGLEYYNATRVIKPNEISNGQIDSNLIITGEIPENSNTIEKIKSITYSVWIYPNGIVGFENGGEVYDLNTIKNPFLFFHEYLSLLQKKEASLYLDYDRGLIKEIKNDNSVQGYLCYVSIISSRYLSIDVKIWSSIYDNTNEMFILFNHCRIFKVTRENIGEIRENVFYENPDQNEILSCRIDITTLDINEKNMLYLSVAILDEDGILRYCDIGSIIISNN